MQMMWEGLTNARDLGGLPTRAGATRSGVLFRADHPSGLTETGWARVRAAGIRRIVSLHTAGLSAADSAVVNGPVHAPWAVESVSVAIEDGADPEFARRWLDTGLAGTPLYFADALQRWPRRHAQALDLIAGADGPVLVHCRSGFDRTGIIVLLVLSGVGVRPDAIVDDYLVSVEALRRSNPAEAAARESLLTSRGASFEGAVRDALDAAAAFWTSGAAPEHTRRRLRAMLVPESPAVEGGSQPHP